MKISNNYKFNYKEETIVITKALANAANVVDSKAYKVLKKLRSDYAGYKIELRTSAGNPKKVTYKNLTYDRMQEVIIKNEGSSSSKLKTLAKAKKDKVPYPTVKKWFLGLYPDYNKSEMPDEEKAS